MHQYKIVDRAKLCQSAIVKQQVEVANRKPNNIEMHREQMNAQVEITQSVRICCYFSLRFFPFAFEAEITLFELQKFNSITNMNSEEKSRKNCFIVIIIFI